MLYKLYEVHVVVADSSIRKFIINAPSKTAAIQTVFENEDLSTPKFVLCDVVQARYTYDDNHNYQALESVKHTGIDSCYDVVLNNPFLSIPIREGNFIKVRKKDLLKMIGCDLERN